MIGLSVLVERWFGLVSASLGICMLIACLVGCGECSSASGHQAVAGTDSTPEAEPEAGGDGSESRVPDSPGARDAPSDTGAVSDADEVIGVVRSIRTGEEVAGLGLVVRREGRIGFSDTTVISDAEGKIRFRAAGSARVVDVAPKYKYKFVLVAYRSADEADGPAQIDVAEATIVRGRVLGPEGKPLAWAEVEVSLNGRWVSGQTCDDAGEFRIPFPRGCEARIAATGRVLRHDLKHAPFENLPIAGSICGTFTSDVAVTIATDRLATELAVTVLSPDGSPVPGVGVRVSPALKVPVALRITDARGLAEFAGLAEGELKVRISRRSAADAKGRGWKVPRALSVRRGGSVALEFTK